jgi:hypothetical protein
MKDYMTIKEISEQTGTTVHSVLKRLKRNAQDGDMFQLGGENSQWLVKREAFERIFSVKYNKK